jgi:hypothetical protein
MGLAHPTQACVTDRSADDPFRRLGAARRVIALPTRHWPGGVGVARSLRHHGGHRRRRSRRVLLSESGHGRADWDRPRPQAPGAASSAAAATDLLLAGPRIPVSKPRRRLGGFQPLARTFRRRRSNARFWRFAGLTPSVRQSPASLPRRASDAFSCGLWGTSHEASGLWRRLVDRVAPLSLGFAVPTSLKGPGPWNARRWSQPRLTTRI